MLKTVTCKTNCYNLDCSYNAVPRKKIFSIFLYLFSITTKRTIEKRIKKINFLFPLSQPPQTRALGKAAKRVVGHGEAPRAVPARPGELRERDELRSRHEQPQQRRGSTTAATPAAATTAATAAAG